MNSCTATVNQYEVGNIVQVNVLFTDAAKAPADPSTITLYVRNPDNTLNTYVYGPDPIVRASAGNYNFPVDATEKGNYFYRWEGSGTIIAAVEGQFVVNSSNVLV